MKILFASMPFDGHFNPLTGIAAHLKAAGHDVRWYAGSSYTRRLEKLGIRHYPFERAVEINQENIGDLFPERAKLRGPALIKFETRQIFISNVENFYLDIEAINKTFEFDAFFCDAAFYALKLIKDKLGKRVFAIGVGPSMETSKDVPPNFAGLKPAGNPLGKVLYQGMRAMMERLVMSENKAYYNAILAKYGVDPIEGSWFDIPYRQVDMFFQSGVPGFAYPRRETNPKVKYVGALLPYKNGALSGPGYQDRLEAFKSVALISQGTVDNKDPGKLIIPALEALKDSEMLLLVATGNAKTAELRQAYPQQNIIIEDYIDFGTVLPSTDVFICNGGYGSVLLSLSKGVPLVTAGVMEGKNDINAHVDYFSAGINLRTERPKPAAIKKAVDKVLAEPHWRANVARLQAELGGYQPNDLIEGYIEGIVKENGNNVTVKLEPDFQAV